MRTSVMRITPDMAKTMVGTNTNNRALRRTRVRQYAEQIKRGQWQATGEAIKFAKDGTLLDGQHRLHAIIEAGVPVELLVVQDLDLSTFKVLDSGLSRRPADALTAMGINCASQKAALVRLYIAVEAGVYTDNSQQMTELITRTDITDYISVNSELVDAAVSASRNVYTHCRGNQPAWGTLYMLIAQKHGQAEAEMFFRTIADGSNLDHGDPRLAVRNWAVRNTNNKRRGDHLWVYTRAWNAYKSNEQIHMMRLPTSSARKDIRIV